MKSKIGQISLGTLAAGGLAVTGWLLVQLYTNMVSGISETKAANEVNSKEINELKTARAVSDLKLDNIDKKLDLLLKNNNIQIPKVLNKTSQQTSNYGSTE